MRRVSLVLLTFFERSAQEQTDLPNDLSIEVEGVGPFAEAMASVARAIVGAIFQEHVRLAALLDSVSFNVRTGLRGDPTFYPRQLVLSQS